VPLHATAPAAAHAPPVVGWAEVPLPPSAEASRRNARALALHRKGDYAGALAGFEATLAVEPGHIWARYNRACALARLGRVRESAAIVRVLLHEDLPEFRRRMLDDPDLASMRAAPEGAELLASLPELAVAYADALARGAPAFVYVERDGWTGGELRKARIPYTDLRIGVYDHATRRFVPMVPRVDGAYSGLLVLDRARAIVAAGELAMKDMWEVQPHRATATVFSLSDLGDTVLVADQVSPRGDVFHGFELWLGPDDSLYGAQYDVGYAPTVEYFRWTKAGRKQIGWTHEDDRRTPPKDMPSSRPSLEVVELAQANYAASIPVRLRAGELRHEGIEGTVKLAKGHHSMARTYASPDPLIFVIASNTIRFSTDGGEEHSPTTRERHVIDLVDMHTHTAARLAFARGYAHVAWAADGTLFLDTPTGVRRYAPGSTEPIADVLPGVRFGTPPFPEEGGV